MSQRRKILATLQLQRPEEEHGAELMSMAVVDAGGVGCQGHSEVVTRDPIAAACNSRPPAVRTG